MGRRSFWADTPLSMDINHSHSFVKYRGRSVFEIIKQCIKVDASCDHFTTIERQRETDAKGFVFGVTSSMKSHGLSRQVVSFFIPQFVRNTPGLSDLNMSCIVRRLNLQNHCSERAHLWKFRHRHFEICTTHAVFFMSLSALSFRGCF